MKTERHFETLCLSEPRRRKKSIMEEKEIYNNETEEPATVNRNQSYLIFQ